jgi:RNA polymerase sigma-70 factor (ECF subfamily)
MGARHRNGMEVATPLTMDARQGFEALLVAHRGIIFKVAGSYAGNPADRDELAQEIAAQLWRAWPSYDHARPVATWMYRIALNVGISQLRSRQQRERHHEPVDEQAHDLAGPDAAGDERLEALQRCIAALDPMHRALLLLYLDERSQREIAEILGISESNVSTRIARLKQRLRSLVA